MPSESYDAAASLLQQIHDLPAEVFHPTWIDFPTIACERRWSSGEWALITAAWDLFNGCGECKLRNVIADLDDAGYAAFVDALQKRRPAAFETNLVSS